jgi:hypothetical protein
MQRPSTTRPTSPRPATHAGATRRPSGTRPGLLSDRRIVTGGAVVLLLLLVWLVWPSPYSKVRNLASSGSSVVAFGDSLTAGYGVPRLDPADGDYASSLFPGLAVSSGTGIIRYYRAWA